LCAHSLLVAHRRVLLVIAGVAWRRAV